MPPIHNRPSITQNDVQRGYVTRYFVQNVSRRNIVEVDRRQYDQYRNDPFYQCVDLQWVITGNDRTVTLKSGVSILGVFERNTVTVDFFSLRMPGLRDLLKNPLQYFSGTRVSEQQRFNAPFTPAPAITPAPTPTPTIEVGAVILNLDTDGRVAAYSTSPISGSVESWSTSSLSILTSNGGISIVSSQLRISQPSSGTTLAYPSGSPRLDTGFIQTVIVGASTGINSATAGLWGRVGGTLSQRRVQVFTSAYGAIGGQVQGLSQVNDGNVTVTGSTVNTGSVTPTTLQLAIENNVAQSWESTNNRAFTIPLSGSAFTGSWGVIGTGPNNSNVTIGEMYLMRSRNVRVQYDRTTPWYAVVTRDDGRWLQTSSVSTGGTASIDLFSTQWRFPTPAGVEIRDVATNGVLYYNYPTRRVWGGDVYTVKFVSGAADPSPAPTEFTVVSSERTQLGRIVAMQSASIANVSTLFNVSLFQTSSTTTLTTSSNNLVISFPSGAFSTVTNFVASGSFDDMYVQMRSNNRTGQVVVGPTVNGSGSLVASSSYAELRVPNGFVGTISLAEYVSGSSRQSVSHGSTLNVNIPQRMFISKVGSTIRSWTSASNANVAQTLVTSSILPAGMPGIVYAKNNASAASTTITDYIAMRSDVIRVQANLPISFGVRLRNGAGTLLMETYATGGLARVDTFTGRVIYPDVTRMEIISPSGSVLHTIEPTERIWGGDIWNITVTQ